MELHSREVDGEPRSAFTERRGRPSYGDFAILTIVFDAILVVSTAAMVVHFLLGVPLSWLTSDSKFFTFQITATDAIGCLALFMVALFVVAWHYGLYSLHQPRSGWNEQRLSMQACLAAGLLLSGALYLSAQATAPRSTIGLIVGATAFVLGARRAGTRLYQRRMYTRGAGRRRLLIAGENRISEALRSQIEQNPHFGYEFRGFLRVPGAMSDRCCPRADVAGAISDVEEITRRSFIDEVVITEFGNTQQLIEAVAVARESGLDLRILPGIHDPLTLHGPLSYLGSVPLVSLHRRQPPRLSVRLKGFIDLALASGGLVLCLPVMSVVAAALVLEGKGEVLTATECIGKRTDTFYCYRFRTRSAAGARDGSGLRRGTASMGDSWICRFLARTRLDGLPLLFNVLSGDMSFVGPRLMLKDAPPGSRGELATEQVRPGHLETDQLLPEQLRCLSILPGLTGAWRVRGLRKGSFERSLAVDAKYVDEWSLWLDATILTRSVGYMLLEIGSGLGQVVPQPSTDVELS